MSKKSYLGDGVYIEWNGYSFVLTTSNGKDITNEIVLEIEVWLQLTKFVESLKE